MAYRMLHTEHHSENEQPIARNPTLFYNRCQKVLHFLDNRTQLMCKGKEYGNRSMRYLNTMIYGHDPERSSAIP